MNQNQNRNARNARNAGIVCQDAINQHRAVIVGVGAIGSHLAEMLAKLGVLRFTLIDPDEIDTVNLGVQGFYEAEVGCLKVRAVADRLREINSAVEVHAIAARADAEMFRSSEPCVVFLAVDSITTRTDLYRAISGGLRQTIPVLFDGRMAAESLQAFCVNLRERDQRIRYRATLFDAADAYQDGCTSKATIYCAAMAAAILTALYKRWAMAQEPEFTINVNLATFDVWR